MWTLSGNVTLNGTGLANVVMNGLPGNPATNAKGAYTATVSNGWTGTVTPTLAGYTFTPPSQAYTNVTANQTQDYTATAQTWTISGTVALNGTGLANVVMAGLPGNPAMDAQGAYTATATSGWSGTVTPVLAGYTFTLVSEAYTNVTSNQTQDHTAAPVPTFTISGTVRLFSGAGLANVVMSGLPGNPTTNAQGAYTATVASGWSGTATPTLADYAFTPALQPYTSVTASQTQDYAAICSALTAPASVHASAGNFTDKVQITWDPVTGADGYEVFRADSDDSGAATQIGTTSGTHYDDTTAAASTATSGFLGCNPQTTTHDYFYWVKATNSCGESDFSAASNGYRGASSSKVYEKVLPKADMAGSTIFAAPDTVLSVRLRSSEPIEPGSAWGEVAGRSIENYALEWLPQARNPPRTDGFSGKPEPEWVVGDVITVTAGAKTTGGDEVEPIVYEFTIQATLLGDKAGRTAVTLLEVGEQGAYLPVLDGAIGPQYEIGPMQAFDTPQQVWLPLPKSIDPATVTIYYYFTDNGSGTWYVSDDVEGWLEPESISTLDSGNVRYLGFSIRHGGIVQLAIQQEIPHAEKAGVIPLNSMVGDMALIAAVLLLLAIVGHTRTRNSRA